MSRTIDQQVVEMQFDNQHFEKNVSKSMSTLDKLKQSLNLTGASKGLENINAAAKNNNMGVLGNSVEAVRVKFSAMQIMGVTALANITNSAVNAGKRIAKALTIDPVKTGFQEYETQIGAIQTILANTESKGTTLEQVNSALDELNTYADKTIYNFTQMTRNIGTFTAAGVGLNESVSAIKGIANLAAVSGSTSQQASTAMYQLSQALASGTVKLQDWNSVVNAGMGGQVFQDALKRTAKHFGYNVDAMIKKYGSFRESLTQGEWLTKDVLTETLSQMAGAYSKADLIAQGYSESQAEEITKLAKTAEDAATKVKTFTQLIDTVKESVQSGWTQTWEILIGDFGEAKEVFSGISDFLGNIIGKTADARNNFLGNVFNSPWKKLSNTITNAGYSVDDFTDKLRGVLGESKVKELEKQYESLANAIRKGVVPIKKIKEALKELLGVEDKANDSTKKVAKSVEDLGKIAKKVINGDFGNGAERIKKLTEAGYNYAEVQNKVNELLGSSVKHTVKATESQGQQIASLVKLTDAQLKEKGYTEDQIKALRELEEVAEGTGQSYDELIENMTRPGGRDLLIDSFKNIGDFLVNLFNTIGDAWKNVFGEKDENKSGNWLYDLIEDFHALTEKLNASEESLKSFQKIVEGLFATSKIGTKIISKSLLSGLTLINAICTALGTDMLTVAGKIGEKIVQFSNWLTDKNLFGYDHIKHLGAIIAEIYTGIKECINEFLKLEKVQAIIKKFKETFQKLFGADTFSGIADAISPEGIIKKIRTIFDDIKKWIKKAGGTENLGKYLIEGLIKGIKSAIEGLFGAIVIVVDTVINTFKTLFGIHSPSTVMMTLGGFLIAGLIMGMIAKGGELGAFFKDFGTTLLEGFKGMLTSVGDVISKIDFGKIVAVGLSVGLIFVIKQLADALKLFGSPLDALTGLFEGVKKAVTGVGDALSGAIKLRSRVGAIKNMAISLAILAGALWVLSKIPWPQLWMGIGALVVLSGVMIGLAIACEKLDTVGSFGLKSASIAAIAISLLALAAAFKILSTIDADNLKSTIGSFVVICVGLIGVFAALSRVTKGAGETNFKGLGKVFTKLAIALLLMVGVIKLASLLKAGDILKAAGVMGLMAVFYRSILTVCQGLDGESVKQVGKTARRLSTALIIMIGVIKLASMLSWGEIGKGTVVILGIATFLAAAVAMTKRVDGSPMQLEKMKTIGLMLLALSTSMVLMGIAIKMVGGMDVAAIGKGALALGAMTAMMGALVALSKYSGEHAHKAGLMLIEFSVAMLILTAVLIILKELDPDGIKQAMGIIAGVAAIYGVLIFITKYAENADKVQKMLATLAVTLGIIAVSILALSFIDQKALLTAGGVLSGVIAVFALLTYCTRFISNKGKKWLKIVGVLAVLTVIVVGLSFIIKMVADLEPDNAVGAATSLGVLLTTLSASLWILSKSSELQPSNLIKAVGALAALSLVVAGLSVIIRDLGIEDPTKAIGTAAAIGMLLMALSGSFNLIAKSKSISQAKLPGVLKTIGLLIGAIVVISVMLKVLNECSPLNAVTSSIAIGILLLALTDAFDVIADSKTITKAKLPGVLKTLGLLVGAIAVIAVVIAALSTCNPLPVLASAAALSVLLISLAIALDIISYSSPTATAAIGSLAILTGVVAGLSVILGIMAKMDIQPSIRTAAALSVLLLGMSSALVILGVAGLMGPAAFVGVSALIYLVEQIGILMVIVSGLVALFPDLNTFLQKGIPIFESIGQAIGAFFGGIGKGFTESMASTLPVIGDNLSQFMEKADGFITGLQSISSDDTLIAGAKSLAGAVLALVGAEFLSGIASFLSLGTSSLPWLGLELSSFMVNAWAFFTLIKKIDPSVMESVKLLSEAMLNLTSAQLLNAISGLLGSEIDFGKFGEQLEKFGTCIVAFNNSVKDANIDQKAVEAARDAGLIMVELQKAIVPMGGVVQAFAGQKNLGDFGLQLEAYGTAIANFSKTVSAKGAINEDAITAAKNAGMIMTELQGAIEPTKGVLQWFAGDVSLDNFGEQLKAYGQAVVDFSKVVSADGAIQDNAIASAANAGKLMAEVQKSIPEDKWLDGKANLEQFGLKMSAYGTYIAAYSKKVADLDVEKVDASMAASKQLVSIARSVANIENIDKITNFEKVKGIGTTMKAYSDSVANIDSAAVSASITSADRLKRFINSLVDFKDSGVDAFKNAVKNLGDANLNGIVDAFNSSVGELTTVGSNIIEYIVKGMQSRRSAVAQTGGSIIVDIVKGFISKADLFAKAGVKYIDNLIKGLNEKKSAVQKASESIGKSAAGEKGAKLAYSSFESAGKYVVDGFASGIKLKAYVAVNAAEEMAKAAAQAAKDALKINSPSKIFMGLGSGVVEGFVKGIYDNTRDVVNASEGIADTARSGFSNAIGRVTDYLNGNMDAQPTIRPVLDLSDVESGAATIGSMFGNPSVGVMSNFGAINTMMNRRNQNGVNDDVVDAINKLGGLLGGNAGNTYQINGITYNDDTPIANAVSDLIRAITLEGRV